MENVVIDWLHGFCPVQAEGTVDRIKFYFRARGTQWRIGIGGDVVAEPDWGYGEPYGNAPFDVGWMPEDEALRFIEKAVALYRAGHPNTPFAVLRQHAQVSP
jgi:hypothetical protein